MKTKITDEKFFYFSIPELVAKITTLILKDFDATPLEAMKAVYSSPTYAKLEKSETGLWKWTPKKLYEDFLLTTNRLE